MIWLDNIQIQFLARLILAVFLGALIGIERGVSKKHAGMRTYSLVSLGASLFTIMSEITYQYFMNTYGGTISYDPTRMISQIVVGVGFLGAGMVIVHRERIFGLTSAAGIWVSAAVGAAVGIGAYFLAISATILVLFILTIMRQYEHWIKSRNDKLANKED